MLARLPLEKIAECLSELCAVQVMALKKVRPPMLNLGGGREKIGSPETPPVGQELPSNAGGGSEPGSGPQNGAAGAFWGEGESRDGFGEPRGGLGCGEGKGKILPELFGVILELLG